MLVRLWKSWNRNKLIKKRIRSIKYDYLFDGEAGLSIKQIIETNTWIRNHCKQNKNKKHQFQVIWQIFDVGSIAKCTCIECNQEIILKEI